jgi:hypothetical protein
MGTYKVPQNVEAEDKILGPLSLKQFIYAMIGVGYGLLTFAILKPITIILWVIIGLPPMLFLVGLGLYQREDQPLETFVVAIAEFFVRPRVRLWDKEPIAEVFRLTPPPPKPEVVVRDPSQVRSQLSQLADLVDTRGWSVKEPELQEQASEMPVVDLQDRLGAEVLKPEPMTALPDVTEQDDILSPHAMASQNLGVLIENSVKSIHEEAMERMRAPKAINPAAVGITPAAPTEAATVSGTATTPPAVSISGSTAAPSDAIVKLATEGGDLTVSQLASQARRHYSDPLVEGQPVSLHNAQANS